MKELNPTEIIQNDFVDACQGNPGALRVLMELSKYDSSHMFAWGVCQYMKVSNSSSPYLWRIYKDVFDYDIRKTRDYLTQWLETINTKPMSLDEFFESQGH